MGVESKLISAQQYNDDHILYFCTIISILLIGLFRVLFEAVFIVVLYLFTHGRLLFFSVERFCVYQFV